MLHCVTFGCSNVFGDSSMRLVVCVQVLKDCPWGREASITVQRGGAATPTKNKWKKGGVKDGGGLDSLQPPVSPRKPPVGAGLFRSKTPTADLYRSVLFCSLLSFSVSKECHHHPLTVLISFVISVPKPRKWYPFDQRLLSSTRATDPRRLRWV